MHPNICGFQPESHLGAENCLRSNKRGIKKSCSIRISCTYDEWEEEKTFFHKLFAPSPRKPPVFLHHGVCANPKRKGRTHPVNDLQCGSSTNLRSQLVTYFTTEEIEDRRILPEILGCQSSNEPFSGPLPSRKFPCFQSE